MMISKTQYTKYLQCPKLFWLYRNDTEKLSPKDFHQLQIIKTGSEVGKAARQLFPNGTEIPFNINDIPAMVQKTKDLLDSGITTIYEAAFFSQGLFIAVDILHLSKNKWHLYEVKSSTRVKETYLDDISFQAHVIECAGLDLGSASIIHINNRYRRDGELDLNSLFSIVDVSERIAERQHIIPSHISKMKELLQKPEPRIDIGPQCFSPHLCGSYDYCWRDLAQIPEQSVFSLIRAHMDQKLELYHSGITNLKDVPLEGRTPRQQLQIIGMEYIEKELILNFVDSLEYPITHLDFECYQQAIPLFDGIKAFQQIPFQYSIHIETDEKLEHKEFLAPIGIDPRRLLAEQLIKDIPQSGTILAYNRVFENGVINGLAAVFPDLSESLLSIACRIEDLMIPFQKGWYYHPQLNGSYSIKKVMPALVPEMETAYNQLPVVHNGGEASAIWSALVTYEDQEQIETIRSGLLEYCKLDTLAMVKILEKLRIMKEN